MKLLFALVSISLCCFPLPSQAAKRKKKDATEESAPGDKKTPAGPRELVPVNPDLRVRKPGFWERAWVSAGHAWNGAKKVGRTVTSPFHRGPREGTPESGWRKLSMSMTLDPVAVKLPDVRSLRVAVTVVNTGKEAVQLEFPNSQRIDVLVKTTDGKVLSKWSEDQKLDPEEGFVVINPQERLEYSATISTRDMSPGNSYVIEAFFTNFDELRASRTVVPTK